MADTGSSIKRYQCWNSLEAGGAGQALPVQSLSHVSLAIEFASTRRSEVLGVDQEAWRGMTRMAGENLSPEATILVSSMSISRDPDLSRKPPKILGKWRSVFEENEG